VCGPPFMKGETPQPRLELANVGTVASMLPLAHPPYEVFLVLLERC
jgi:hypothetical protein